MASIAIYGFWLHLLVWPKLEFADEAQLKPKKLYKEARKCTSGNQATKCLKAGVEETSSTLLIRK